MGGRVFAVDRYSWGCGCGANPKLSSIALAKKWAPEDGTEYV
jgi:hypothetical protein